MAYCVVETAVFHGELACEFTQIFQRFKVQFVYIKLDEKTQKPDSRVKFDVLDF